MLKEIVGTIVAFFLFVKHSRQDCSKEISNNGISVLWSDSAPGYNITSEPICYGIDGKRITRNCNGSMWYPELNGLSPCMKVIKNFDLNSCPPGYSNISENNTEYCYQIGNVSAWNYPCFESGGATVITDLDKTEVSLLLKELKLNNQSRYFWLPAQRQKYFNPIVWTIPGPNWGRVVERNNNLLIQQSLFENCLLLDIENGIVVTDNCDKEFPSLCFYINNFHYPSTCPAGYHSFRYMADKGICFGIEYADNIFGKTFNDFLGNKCRRPMGDNKKTLTRFLFKKIAELSELNDWCWFKSSYVHNGSHIFPRDPLQLPSINSDIITDVYVASFEGIINNEGTLSLMNTQSTLKCMACEAEMIYNETEFMFEYNNVDETMYLTVYFPSGLWKYETADKGVQCFSDAKGFVNVINIEDIPYFKSKDISNDGLNVLNLTIDKIVYKINPVSDRSAQYWCQGHTQNFTMISTDKIVVNPQGNKDHVFALIIKIDNYNNDDCNSDCNFPDFEPLIDKISVIFNANKVLIMDILDMTRHSIKILFHIHVCVIDNHEDEAMNLKETYDNLTYIGTTELPKNNMIFLNMSSSTHCFATTSHYFYYNLNWELTPIGQIAAPKEFCLQSNGLPVKRQCCGSYLIGSVWGPVEGYCSKNYEASDTTTFLYNVAKGQTTDDHTSRFLTDGLNYVLNDTDIIIPADIYYLSMSLQYVVTVAQENISSVDIGDIENIAWAMNRVMVLDDLYLRLSQTLNSTNVIVDTINDVIDLIAIDGKTNNYSSPNFYQIAVNSKFVTQISYPLYNNITGLALLRQNDSDDFTKMTVVPLYRNTTINDIIRLRNIEVATWVPENVLSSLEINNNKSEINKLSASGETTGLYDINMENVHIVINVFYNNAVFQELGEHDHILNSRIIGISIPGCMSNLKHSVPLFFKPVQNTNASKICSYWDFHEHSTEDVPGFWKNKGCFYVDSVNNLTMCKCYHLTNFGQLISLDFDRYRNDTVNSNNEKHSRALNAITLVGCFLSLAGVVGLWITAIVFHSWRKKPGTKILLQLSTAIAIPLVLILVFNLDNTIFVEHKGTYVIADHMKPVCVTLGALLHYSVLSEFLWMLITAVLQFMRYVRVLGVQRPSMYMIKFTLIGWGIPLLPVLLILILDSDNYLPPSLIHDAYSRPICYPTGRYFIYFVVAPILIILTTNIVLFVTVLYSISRGPNGKMRAVDLDMIRAQLRLSIFLFFLLGLTWFFGILTFAKNIIWSYLFCLTSTLQGFVLFIYFVVCDPATRGLWITFMTPQFRSTSRESIVSYNN